MAGMFPNSFAVLLLDRLYSIEPASEFRCPYLRIRPGLSSIVLTSRFTHRCSAAFQLITWLRSLPIVVPRRQSCIRFFGWLNRHRGLRSF
jgi:hypothetical protein